MQLIVEKRGYRVLPLLALAVAIALLAFIARDTLAVHNDEQLEIDGNTAFDGGQGFDPGVGNCPYSVAVSSNAVDCIQPATDANYDWADDGNAANGDQGVCTKDGTNLIVENTASPKGDLRRCIRDFVVASTADTSYHTGSDKDFQEIWNGGPDDWGCVKLNNATNKADLKNAYVVQVRPTSGASAGDQVMYFGAERDTENGSVYNGFWFLQKAVKSDCPPSLDGDFCPSTTAVDATCSNPGIHKCGDVLILFNYDSGGRIGNIGAYQWVDNPAIVGFDPADGCDQIPSNADDCTATQLADSETHDTPNGVLCIKTSSGLGDCRSAVTLFDGLCGRVNGTTTCTIAAKQNDPNPPPCSGPGAVTTPWAPGCATPGTNCAGPRPSPTFSEAGANLTALNLEIGCVASFVAESRSSPSVDATLKDYAVGEFPACALGWEKRDESIASHPLQGGATFTVDGADGNQPGPNTGEDGPFGCSGDLTDPKTVVDDSDGTTSGSDVDKNAAAGRISLPDVCPGTYSVCESAAPSGYARDNSLCRSISVSTGDPNANIGTPDVDDCAATPDEQDFCNRLGSIEWEKRNDTGALQSGATFNISPNPFACHDPAGTNPSPLSDDADNTDGPGPDQDGTGGQLKLTRVCLGNYTITEATPPSGFALDDDTTRPCNVTEAAVSCVVGAQGVADDCPDTTPASDGDETDFCNRIGSLEWEKRSDVDGSLQAGATFNISPNPFACRGGTDPSPLADDADNVDGPGPDQDGTGGQLKLTRVCIGNYTITEATAPAGFAKDPDDTRICNVTAAALNCVVGTQGVADDCPDANDPVDTDEADFCNLVGSLFWEKRGKDASTPETGNELLPGSVFSVTGTGVNLTNITDCTSGPCTAGACLDQDPQKGQFCLDIMPIGVLLTIDETSTATGYIQTSPANNGNLTTTLSSSSTCAGTPTDAGDFINQPLSKFEIKFICLAQSPSDVTKCATAAKITCPTPAISPTPDDVTPNNFDDVSEVYGDALSTLLEGTYNCTIVIDP